MNITIFPYYLSAFFRALVSVPLPVMLGIIICLLAICVYLIFKLQGSHQYGNCLIVYCVVFLLLGIMFCVVSVHDAKNTYHYSDSGDSARLTDWEYIINGNKIEIYEVHH